MKTVRLFLCSCLILLSLSAQAQIAKTNTLLWRITGNALSKPSYLFGTMHVTDSKAFHFQDSLYRFLETAEAFAMEVHPDSASNLFSGYLNRDAGDEIDWEKRLGKAELKQLEQQLNKAARKLPAGSKSRKLKYLLNTLMNAEKKEGDAMDTFMDAYLYEVAKRQTKEIFGLEQVADQLAALSVLPKGLQVQNFLKLMEKWNPTMESPIHQMYYKEDIEEMEGFYRTIFTDSVLQVFLYNRNNVMVNKMDSLMQRKSLFTAVGAGHLAGTQGVIALLKEKGYSVEPVFSNSRIKATDYRLKEASLNWQVQQNSNQGFAYSMPGTPTLQTSEDGSEVALYYDIGNGLTYMVVSGPLNKSEREKGFTTFHQHLQGFIQRTEATLLSTDTMATTPIALEALCKAKDNSYYRYRELQHGNMFYIFTLVAQNKEPLYSTMADHYFASFKPIDGNKRIWKTHAYTADGFTIELPVTLKEVLVKLEADANKKLEWKNISGFDHQTTNNYTLHVSKAKAGSELIDDWFFDHYINNLEQNTGGQEVQVMDTTINGYTAKSFTGAAYNEVVTKGLIVKRGNYNYYIAGSYNTENAAVEVERFLSSFRLTPFDKKGWQQTKDPQSIFSVWAPGPIRQFERDEDEPEDAPPVYYTYNTATADNYLIRSTKLSKYVWAEQLDSLYNYWIHKEMNTWSDTLVHMASVTNGNLPAKEVWLQNKETGIITKARFVLNGNEMYELSLTMPPAFADTSNLERFLQSFTILHPKSTEAVFANKPELLFMDLQLEDSSYFTNAYQAMDELPFKKKELPLLLQQCLQEFPAVADGYRSVNLKVLDHMQKVLKTFPGGNDTLFNFIKQHYHQLDSGVQHIQYRMLQLLVEDARPQAVILLKELWQQKPAEGFYYPLFYALENKPAVAATLFPLFFQYVDDKELGSSVLALANQLADSGFISLTVLQQQQNALQSLLSKNLKSALKDKDVQEAVFPLLSLAGKLNLPQLNSAISKYLAAKDIWIKFEAAVALLKNGQPVPAPVLQALAADKHLRAKLYGHLKQNNRPSLFPAAYRTQKSMAESYIYAALKEDDEYEGEPKFIYIKTIEQLYEGEKKRFFLFRLNMDASEEVGDENPTSLLSIAGPFNLEPTKIDIAEKDNISGTYYNSTFDGMLLDVYFKKYLQLFIKSSAEK